MAKMRGLKELLENLQALDRSIDAEARVAANAAAQVVKKEAVRLARMQGLVDTGALVKNIAVKRERDAPKNIKDYHIGVRHGAEAKGAQRIAIRNREGKIRFEWTDNPFYWWFWEFGFFNKWLNRHMPARPFMRPAMDNKQSELLEIMRQRLADRIEKFADKALK